MTWTGVGPGSPFGNRSRTFGSPDELAAAVRPERVERDYGNTFARYCGAVRAGISSLRQIRHSRGARNPYEMQLRLAAGLLHVAALAMDIARCRWSRWISESQWCGASRYVKLVRAATLQPRSHTYHVLLDALRILYSQKDTILTAIHRTLRLCIADFALTA